MNQRNLAGLDSIIWHELGHFIIDSLFVQKNNNYEITKFEIEKNIGGKIKIEKINKDNFDPFESIEVLSYYLVSLTFGVILESIYLTIYSSQKIKPIELFKPKKSGSDDCSKFINIRSKIRHDNLGEIVKSKFEEFYHFLLNDNSTITVLKNVIIEIKKELNVSLLNDNLFELKKDQIVFFQNEILKSEEYAVLFQKIENYLGSVENVILKIY